MSSALSVAPSTADVHTSERDSSTRPPWNAERVFHEHGARIYRLARRMLDQDADAEDVTQEVLLQVVRKLDTFRHEAELSTWLYRVTVNAALALRRKCARHPERPMPAAMEGPLEEDARIGLVRRTGSCPERRILHEETRALLDQAIAALPPLYRDVFVLAELAELPSRKIGGLLQMGVAAVKSRLHRARRFMREALAPYFKRAHVA
jgi:RNA polymerase sigma-70 factor (ECF subfamily)